MPQGKTLCARCGELIDGDKNALDICAQCDQDLEENK
jgi:NMD protein affecting ribosome stability and mRNA decay